MQRPTKTIFGLFAASLAACAFASTGCTAPMQEQIGSRTEKLLAPEAILTTHASALTKSELGIAKWKVFRGKNDYVLTGYDDDGKAVKGISFTWSASSSKTKSAPVLKARVLDGTRAAMRHTFDGSKKTEANKTLSKSTRLLLARATFDMGAAGASIFGKHHGGKTPPPGYFGEGFPGGGSPSPTPTTPAPTTPGGGTTPFPPDDPFGGMGYPGGDPTGGMNPGACGMDMSSMIMSALQCLMSGGLGGGTTGGAGGGGNLMMCLQAAAAGAGIGGSCADPTGGAGPTGDPTGGTDPTGGGTDPTGGGTGPTGGGPYGDLGGASDPYGSGAADQAGGPMSCMSCPEGGGYGDIGMDPSNGDVYGGGAPGGGYGPDSGFGAGW
ncbi:MAG: hypothetical protein JST00_22650 [Deltaproteobacteria bacterium]|nr:hypothetical protein [Deltaproteobacteria bacterium]